MMRALGALLVGSTLLLPLPALADTPISGLMEFKFGGYLPQIDAEHGLTTNPYSSAFDNNHVLLFQFEWEEQFYQKFGSLAGGLSIGYGEIYGHGKFDADTGTDATSTDTTALKVLPLKALLVYRFDVLSRRYNVPLVPFAKVGLVFEPWECLNGTGDVCTVTGSTGSTSQGKGANWGWEADLGLALQLDWFDPTLAKDMDLDLGINHAYFFAEWSDMSPTRSSPVSQPNRIRLNDKFLNFGLALEY